jgi:hypothetical protein
MLSKGAICENFLKKNSHFLHFHKLVSLVLAANRCICRLRLACAVQVCTLVERSILNPKLVEFGQNETLRS